MSAILDRVYDVCMVTTRHPLRDHRVFHKEAVSLAKRSGLRVLVLAITDRDEAVEEGGVAILGVKGSQRHVLRSVLRVGRVLRKVKASVFHIHDLEALTLMPYLKYLKGKPVVYDVHEDYELMMQHVVKLPDLVRTPLARIVRAYEYVFSHMSDHLVLVAEFQKDRFRGFSIAERRMSVIRNLASLAGFAGVTQERRFDLVYSGSCYAARGVYELLDAIKAAESGPKPLRALLLLVGRQDEIDKLQQRISELELQQLIEVRTFVAYDALPSALGEARIGIVFFHDVASHRSGIPTKLMEYGAARLPTLANDVNAFAIDYIGRYRAGVVIQALSPEAILEGVARIDTDYDGYAARAREAAQLNSWEADEPALIALYERLLARG